MKYSSHNSTQQCGTVETIDLTSEYSVRGKSGVRCAPSTNPKWSKGCSPSSHRTDFLGLSGLLITQRNIAKSEIRKRAKNSSLGTDALSRVNSGHAN
ncbi:hypothetical protein TNCT_470431 [Trichonephila clavata]|uniref:Uncharacterized protein n=1 Tax=Trichonephila clavata TaxID=2740835 RepID=A0A8X6GRA4_TRICU|nr:hypothetical protein TNCT_470431 [Trichonephila clavata]